MKNQQIVARAILQALGVTAYVAVVSWVLNNGERIFGDMNKFIGPVAFLLLFLFSALVTGSLVIGKPLMLYLDGEKKEAVHLFMYTGLSLFILLAAIFLVMLAIK